MKRLISIAAAAALSVACGGAVDPFDGGEDGSAEAAPDGAPDASGPLTCGSDVCGGGEYCIHPCCGGAPPPCIPFDDGGTCPAGYTPSNQCWGQQTGTSGCQPAPCTPPPPYCAPAPPSFGCDLQSGSRDCYEACG